MKNKTHILNHSGSFKWNSNQQLPQSQKTLQFSQTVWPTLTVRETPFLPEFQVRPEMIKKFNVISHIYFRSVCTNNRQIFVISNKMYIIFHLHQVLSDIASGAYGKVSQVIHQESGNIYAMKSISKSKVRLFFI